MPLKSLFTFNRDKYFRPPSLDHPPGSDCNVGVKKKRRPPGATRRGGDRRSGATVHRFGSPHPSPGGTTGSPPGSRGRGGSSGEWTAWGSAARPRRPEDGCLEESVMGPTGKESSLHSRQPGPLRPPRPDHRPRRPLVRLDSETVALPERVPHVHHPSWGPAPSAPAPVTHLGWRPTLVTRAGRLPRSVIQQGHPPLSMTHTD